MLSHDGRPHSDGIKTIALDPARSSAANWLGAAGVVPFLLALLLAFFGRTPEQRELGARAFVLYSGIILSFLGGIRWGAALPAPSLRLLALAVSPSLLAFGALLLPLAPAVVILAVSFAVVGLVDSTRGAHALWPQWFKQLRMRLSIAVVCLHAVLYLGAPQFADLLSLPR
jgi:hypothetical protein